jgi:hypothetical protein
MDTRTDEGYADSGRGRPERFFKVGDTIVAIGFERATLT